MNGMLVIIYRVLVCVHSYSFEATLVRSYNKEEKELLLKIRLVYIFFNHLVIYF